MYEQLKAKARKADTLAANKDFVAAAALAAECVALAKICRISASQSNILTRFHEGMEHMVKFQQQIAGLKFDPSYRWMHSMQPGSSDAGKAASLLLKLGRAKYATGDFEGTLRECCSGRQAQLQEQCHHAANA